jgi:hypothetical protein
MADVVRTCFAVPGGKVHILEPDFDRDRFPLGRAKCAPFPRKKSDALVEPNQVSSEEFCNLCLKIKN